MFPRGDLCLYVALHVPICQGFDVKLKREGGARPPSRSDGSMVGRGGAWLPPPFSIVHQNLDKKTHVGPHISVNHAL